MPASMGDTLLPVTTPVSPSASSRRGARVAALLSAPVLAMTAAPARADVPEGWAPVSDVDPLHALGVLRHPHRALRDQAPMLGFGHDRIVRDPFQPGRGAKHRRRGSFDGGQEDGIFGTGETDRHGAQESPNAGASDSTPRHVSIPPAQSVV